MSLLQKTLDEIEAEAAKKSQIACLNVDLIADMERLYDLLNRHGAEITPHTPVIHDHYDPGSAKAINTTIVATPWSTDHERILAALDASDAHYQISQGAWGSDMAAIVAVDGYTSRIALLNYADIQQQAAA